MTSSIHDSQDLRPKTPAAPGLDADGRPTRSPIVRGVQIFTSVTALAGVGSLTFAFSHNEWRMGVVGMTFTIIACIGGAVLCVEALLADRNAFYNRGEADGHYKGWRGLPPGVDDPLLRR